MQTSATRTRIRLAALLAGAAIVGGCASPSDIAQSANPRESTLSDAVGKAQGPKGQRHASSQVQLGFGDNKPLAPIRAQEAQEAPATETIRPLREPKTFLGTVPCLEGAGCPAVRITLTVAPNGHWRARYEPTEAQGKKPQTQAEQGCWYPAGSQPWRIVLRTPGQEGSLASMSFLNDNVLRVLTFKDRTPTLNYQLTRQPDLDAIAELDAQRAPDCSAS